MDTTMNLVFITDNNFAILTGTALQSLFEHKNKLINYNIFLVCSEVTLENIELFKKQSTEGFKITIIDVNGEKYEYLKKNNLHVSTAALFKFDIPNIFSNLDKILYIDGDMIYQSDLVDLYNTDLEDNYAGVCVDYCGMSVPSDFRKRLKIKHQYYFNSGMMLFNLQKMRHDKIPEKLLKYRKDGINFYMDQDAFNVVFREKVKYLPITYNFVITTWRNCEKSVFTDFFKLPDYKNKLDYISNSEVIHFASADKPSKYEDVPFADIWYEYYMRSPFSGTNSPRKFLRRQKPNHVFFTKPELAFPELNKPINPLVSVIIPIYNSAVYLKRTIDSVLTQSLKDIEVICVDDGSTDDSLNILKSIKKKDDRIVILEQKNQYAGVARNNGIKKACGDYIVFLDSDDKLEKGALLKLYEKAVKEDADIVLCRAKFLNDVTKEISVAHFVLADRYLPKQEVFSAEDVPEYIMNIAGGNPWAKCYKRSFLLENNLEFLRLKRSEDFYFVRLSLIKAKRITSLKDYLFYYRINNAGSLESTKDEAPLMFWDANVMLKEKLIEDGLYEKYKRSFLNDSLVRYSYNLIAAKTHNTLNMLIENLKSVGNEFFMLDSVDKSYYYQQKNYDDVMSFYKAEDIYDYYRGVIEENQKLKRELNKLKNKSIDKVDKKGKPKKTKPQKVKIAHPKKETHRVTLKAKLNEKITNAKRRGLKWVMIRVFMGHKAADRYLEKNDLW